MEWGAPGMLQGAYGRQKGHLGMGSLGPVCCLHVCITPGLCNHGHAAMRMSGMPLVSRRGADSVQACVFTHMGAHVDMGVRCRGTLYCMCTPGTRGLP